MKDLKEFLIAFFKASEAVKIRSEIIPIMDSPKFDFDFGVLEPYSFEIVNTGSEDFIINGAVVVKGGNANSLNTSLVFPRVGNFKRNDIIKITGGGADLEGFVRADLELVG